MDTTMTKWLFKCAHQGKNEGLLKEGRGHQENWAHWEKTPVPIQKFPKLPVIQKPSFLSLDLATFSAPHRPPPSLLNLLSTRLRLRLFIRCLVLRPGPNFSSLHLLPSELERERDLIMAGAGVCWASSISLLPNQLSHKPTLSTRRVSVSAVKNAVSTGEHKGSLSLHKPEGVLDAAKVPPFV